MKPVVDQRELRVGRRLARESKRRVSVRHQEEDREGDQQHRQEDDDRPDESAGYVDEHRGKLGESPGRLAAPRRSLFRFFGYLTAMCAYAGVVPNWSNWYCVTFVLVMRVTKDQRYGTHGTTFVMSFLSRLM